MSRRQESGIGQQNRAISNDKDLNNPTENAHPQASAKSSNSQMSAMDMRRRSTYKSNQSVKINDRLKSFVSRSSSHTADKRSSVHIALKIKAEVFPSIRLGRFSTWTRDELIYVLVKYGNQELRGERFIPIENLRVYCEEAFEGMMPEKPVPFTADEIEMRHRASVLIQRNWIHRLQQHKWESMINRAKFDMFCSHANGLHPQAHKELAVETLVPFSENPQDISEEARRIMKRQSIAQSNAATQGSDPSQKPHRRRSTHKDNERSRELLDPWIKPDLEYALLYASYNHPRQGGLGGKEYPVLSTTMGRHCCSKGWGEQCNLWSEGQYSELAFLGPGITNYFKFLKWCFWVTLIIALIFFPILVLNVFGPQQDVAKQASLFSLTDTMLGNIGSTNSSLNIVIPGCDRKQYHGDCYITDSNIGLFYALLDLSACIFLLVAYLWLKIFESREEALLNDNTVSASDFTIEVTGLPRKEKFSEFQLRAHFAKVTGQAVAKVVIAYDNEVEIQAYKRRGQLVNQRDQITQQYRYLCTVSKSVTPHEKLDKILKKRENMTKQIKEIDSQMKDRESSQIPILAFVTFEDRFAPHIAVRMYNSSMLRWIFFPRHLKFYNHALSVRLAPEPSTIIWENLNYSIRTRLFRRLFTTTIATICLLFSVCCSFASRSYSQSLVDTGGQKACPAEFNSLSIAEQEHAAKVDPNILHCYCEQYNVFDQHNNHLCSNYLLTHLQADGFIILATLVVLIVNTLMEYIVTFFAKFEKHHAVDNMHNSVFWRLFFLKFLNTGCVFLFANSFTIDTKYNVIYKATNVFNPTWYKTAGISIFLVQVGEVIVPHLPKFYKYYMRQRKIRNIMEDISEGRIMTQEQLNAIFLGPHFELSQTYAGIMCSFLVCFMYSLGIPVLAFVATLKIAVMYWVEKFAFLRLYRTPPRFKTRIGVQSSRLVVYGVLVHLVVSIWMLNNQTVFTDFYMIGKGTINDYVDTYDPVGARDAITKTQILILFILGVILLIMLIVENLFITFRDFFLGIIKYFCGSLTNNKFLREMKEFITNERRITYTRALQRGRIQGLPNYIILQNPKYKEDFAISEQFALTHNHVTDIRKFMVYNEHGEDEAPDESLSSKMFITPDQKKLLEADANLRTSSPSKLPEKKKKSERRKKPQGSEKSQVSEKSNTDESLQLSFKSQGSGLMVKEMERLRGSKPSLPTWSALGKSHVPQVKHALTKMSDADRIAALRKNMRKKEREGATKAATAAATSSIPSDKDNN